jgi:hypothetical protein
VDDRGCLTQGLFQDGAGRVHLPDNGRSVTDVRTVSNNVLKESAEWFVVCGN